MERTHVLQGDSICVAAHVPKCDSAHAYVYEQKLSEEFFIVKMNGTFWNYTGVPRETRAKILYPFLKEHDCIFELEC